MNYFPEEVVEHVFGFVSSHKDRNSISLVCKSWHWIERHSRGNVLVANCYSITPDRVIQRFPALRSLTLKGKPHFADFNLVPNDWGGYVYPWIDALAKGRVNLEELRLKRMVVTDQGLDLISKAFGSFKSLVLVSCDGFSTDGLAAIVANCRHLRELDLQESEVEDLRGHWLSCFPENCTSLVTLNFACLKGDVSLAALGRLVARSPNLKSLRLNQSVPAKALERILASSPRLLDLGIGSFLHDPDVKRFTKLQETIQKCNSLRSLSGFLEVNPLCLPAIHPICSNLTYLNLSYAAGIHGSELIKIIRNCNKLEKLWILDCIGDSGLGVVASCCKELHELRVFPSDPYGVGTGVTEEGLVAISIGCPKLNSILYFCQQMTNAALINVAKNSPNFIRFRLCILDPTKADVITMDPLDEGFGAIVRSCRNIRRLSLSGLLTDKVFFYIGMYAENLEMLSVAFAGNSDKAMVSVLNGCRKLRKLEIRDSPFGDGALLTGARKYETMRSLWMSSCDVTLAGCKALAREMPMLNVEIIHEDHDGMEGCVGGGGGDDDNRHKVEKMFLYRSLVGPRSDAPGFVSTL